MSRERCQSILPEDAKPVLNNLGEVKGITTNDGSFDLTSAGTRFLGSKDLRIENAGITSHGIFINGD